MMMKRMLIRVASGSTLPLCQLGLSQHGLVHFQRVQLHLWYMGESFGLNQR